MRAQPPRWADKQPRTELTQLAIDALVLGIAQRVQESHGRGVPRKPIELTRVLRTSPSLDLRVVHGPHRALPRRVRTDRRVTVPVEDAVVDWLAQKRAQCLNGA